MHVVHHAGKLLSLWEVGLPYHLDIDTLDTIVSGHFVTYSFCQKEETELLNFVWSQIATRNLTSRMKNGSRLFPVPVGGEAALPS